MYVDMARTHSHTRSHAQIFAHTQIHSQASNISLCSAPSRSCECGVNRLLPVCGAVRGGHTRGVSYGSVQRPLCRAHVGEGWVQPRGLAGMGIVRPGGLVLSILKLCPGGQRGESGAIVREAKRGVSDMGAWGRRRGGLNVVTTSSRFALDLSLGGIGGRWRGLRLLLLLGEPGWVPTSSGQGVSIRRGRWSCCRGPTAALRVAVWREVLVKLVHVKRLDVRHHIMADLTDVHGAKVDVGLSTWGWGATRCSFSPHTEGSSGCTWSSSRPCSPFSLGIWQFPRLELCLWGGGGRGWAVTLT